VIILGLFVLVFAGVLGILVPVVANQIGGLAERIPEYVDRFQALMDWLESSSIGWLLPDSEANLKQDLAQLVSEGSGFVTSFIASLWSSSLAVVNFVSLFVVTPVVAFYILLDWDRMVEKVDSWTPRQHAATIRRLARDIDRSVAGFVRGQGSVCLILGTFYGVALTMVGLNFGLLIGLFAGLVSFIPYVGSVLGLILSVGVALVQFWPDAIWVIVVAAIFFTGQFFEGNILQPKLVGASVGLHPVWLMFALFAFGALFGFVGLLMAVPLAAAVGVLVRFALSQYLQSEMYFGRETSREPAAISPGVAAPIIPPSGDAPDAAQQ